MTNLESILEKKFYPRVNKPGRYVGSELNASVPVADDLHIALAFPDLYEIGFAYQGFHILYHILDYMQGVSPQRVFAPAEDAEKIMRENRIPLFTLEAKTPLSELDIIGFTLQYELHATNILNMLDLAEIPLRSEDRGDKFPIILGGGPIAANPEPLTPFFDAFIIGDAEEVLPELINSVRDGKIKHNSKRKILSQITILPGVYSPTFYQPQYDSKGNISGLFPSDSAIPGKVQSLSIEELPAHFYSEKRLVPLISVEHDRLSLEIMRGCSRGCRFCNAGFMHRPTRELAPEFISELMVNTLDSTGYDEVSLLSLSTADYSKLPSLLNDLSARLTTRHVSLSYPSLRVDAFTESVAKSIKGRKTGLTFAPEAGSERLRSVINKDLSDSDLFDALEIASKYGWNAVKLYFMIGLPTETEEDIHAIVNLAKQSRSIMKSRLNKPIHISVSVFSPKPHTPFQRVQMIEPAEARKRLNIIRDGLRSKSFRVSFNNPDMTLVETLLARGDRRLADVIEQVFRLGARFEAWDDKFDLGKWHQAMNDHNLLFNDFTGLFSKEAFLPWDHIDAGFSDDFFIKEWDKSVEMQKTPDCRIRCARCGLECPPPPKQEAFTPEIDLLSMDVLSQQERESLFRYRVNFNIAGAARYISHLEKIKSVERYLRRKRVLLAFTQGFHPHPKISFGPALPLGYAALSESFDFSTISPVDMNGLIGEINGGMSILRIKEIGNKTQSLSSVVDMYRYSVNFEELPSKIESLMEKFWSKKEIYILDRKGNKWNIQPFIHKMDLIDKSLKIDLAVDQGKSPRPDKILEVTGTNMEGTNIIREGCFKVINDKPMDIFEICSRII